MLVKPGGYRPPVLDCESEPIVTFDPNRSDIGRFAPGATAAPVASAPSVTVRPNSVSVDHPHGSKWVKQNGKWTHLVRCGGSEQVCTCSAAPLSRQQVVSAGKREASRFAAAVELNARTVSDVPDGTRWPALTGAATDGCLPVSAGGDAWSVHADAAQAAATSGCTSVVAERTSRASPPSIIWEGGRGSVVAPASPSMAART